MENEDSDSDMIDLSALYSKRMEEAFEDLGIGMEGGPAAEGGMPIQEDVYQGMQGPQGPQNDPFMQNMQAGPVQPVNDGNSMQDGQEGMYAYQDGDMQSYGSGEQYYPFGDNADGVYMNGTEQMFMDMGNLYSEDMYEDDSAAYAQLYNSVNNYDVNGATQEMPINEVLAYRNAFTNEYISRELSKESSDGEGQKAEGAAGKKGKKAKRKSFFSGLFGKKSPDTEEDQGLQGTDVLVRVPELLHVVVVVPSAGRSAAGAIRNQPLLLRVHLVDQRAEGLFVKADIGDGGEQSLDEELVGALRRMGVAVRGAGKADQRAGQFILQRCNVCSFPADAGFPLAAGAACGLFTLEAKHFVFRVGHLLKLLLWRSPGSCHTPPMRPHGTLPVLLRRLQRQRPRRSSKRPPDRFPRTDRSRCSRHLLHTSRVSSSFT